ncbi:phosphatidylglycerophosphatase A [Pelagibacteraceae bacterium]|jgi:phosphatidylglycerophosphatase A|nr:phosphatidylglycerophosphatase A [Pelagibacteraceae bacterium]|tara:strand:- start:237 stop:743 length:507 start_codon:yes stop_codon:yes gene_type:complete
MIKNINFLFVTFFGIGTIRYAPGTITSLITTMFLFSSFHILNFSTIIILIILLLIFFISFYAVAIYIKNDANKDPKEIVIDEVIGQSIPIYMYEIAHGTTKDSQEAILFYLYMFILFRFFDIKKPFPINYFDKKFKNSFGVIFDDVVAGFYVVLTLVVFMVIKSKLFT